MPQLLLTFTHKEFHINLFHTSVAEFPNMLLVKIFTNLSRKKKEKRKKEGNPKETVFFKKLLFTASLRWRSAAITDSETTLTISYYFKLHNSSPDYLYMRPTEPGPPGGSARDPLFSFVAAPHMEDPQVCSTFC